MKDVLEELNVIALRSSTFIVLPFANFDILVVGVFTDAITDLGFSFPLDKDPE